MKVNSSMAYMMNWMIALKTIIHSPSTFTATLRLRRQCSSSFVSAFPMRSVQNQITSMHRLRNYQRTTFHSRIIPNTASSSTSNDVTEPEIQSPNNSYPDLDDTIAVPLDTEQQQQQRRISKQFVAFPFEYHELVDVRIETLTNRGWGLGRVDVSDREQPPPPSPAVLRNRRQRGRHRHKSKSESDDSSADDSDSSDVDFTVESTTKGWVIMTPNVIPGELVRVRIFRNQKKYSEGDAIEILEPNTNERVQPQCPLSNECGGCQYQHISIQAQRMYKQKSVQESLSQYGIVDVTVSPTIGTDEIYGYRSKLTPHYQAPTKRENGIDKQISTIGFLRQTSRSIIDVPSCIIATQAVNEKYQQIRGELLNSPSTRTRGASLLFRQANLYDTVNDVSTDNSDYITTVINGIKFTYQAGNFFQNNYYVVPIMVNEVVRYASLPSASPDGKTMTHLIDCYCGSGLFALSAASKFETVVGIEVNSKAVAEATENASQNSITNCHFRSASAECIFKDIQQYPKDTSVVVLDPPRKGCSNDFLQQLLQFHPQRIVYMSCDPHTQARDAQTILQSSKYQISSVQPFDLFPQTRHIECLIIFERT